MSLTIDIKDGAGGKKTESKGWELTRIATVTGLTGSAHAMIIDAVENTEGMPSIGDAHPARDYAKLRTIEVESVSNDAVTLRLIYRDSDIGVFPTTPNAEAVIEVGASVSQLETNKDYTGALMSTTYTYPASYKHNAEMRSQTVNQGAMVSRLIPQRVYRASKRETTTAYAIESLNDLYQGKVNSGVWRGYSARTWLCMGISGSSDDGGTTYNVTYDFQYRPDTWDESVFFIDPYDGKPPQDISGDAQKTYQIYSTANFNNLDI